MWCWRAQYPFTDVESRLCVIELQRRSQSWFLIRGSFIKPVFIDMEAMGHPGGGVCRLHLVFSVRDAVVNKMGKDTTLLKLMPGGRRVTDVKQCGN